MDSPLRSSVVVIGDEVLAGFVQDTNSGWLARRLHDHGVPLDRVVTVPDEHEPIAAALRAELARPRPRVLFTTGGVGSTPDDVTMEAIARCLEREVRVVPAFEARIRATLAATARQGVVVSAEHERSMQRMALAPAGAYLIPSDDDPRAAVAVDVDGGSRGGGATIVILPGVPALVERGMVSVEDALLAGRGRPVHVAELRHPYPESLLNPVLDRLVTEFPDLHVGSYPGRECLIRLKGKRERVEEAVGVVRGFLDHVSRDPSADRMREMWQAAWT